MKVASILHFTKILSPRFLSVTICQLDAQCHQKLIQRPYRHIKWRTYCISWNVLTPSIIFPRITICKLGATRYPKWIQEVFKALKRYPCYISCEFSASPFPSTTILDLLPTQYRNQILWFQNPISRYLDSMICENYRRKKL